ncbi:Site-specific DNA-methyltransferase (adenine-specific) (Fragment), partial [Durusdinium trenchii]
VERMVRLSNVNLKVFAESEAAISLGNSVIGTSPLDVWKGKLDLILTNPPFGASFSTQDILSRSKPADFPVLHHMANIGLLPQTIDSEYALLDKEIGMLRPGGRILMVVPDHVVSGGGFAERFRRELLKANRIGESEFLQTTTIAAS